MSVKVAGRGASTILNPAPRSIGATVAGFGDDDYTTTVNDHAAGDAVVGARGSWRLE